MRKTALILFFLGILSFGYYVMIFEPNNIKIEKETITLNNLPRSFDGVKIIQLSDLHSLKFGQREKKVIEMIETLNPDFIFITGDFIVSISGLKDLKNFWETLGKKYKNRIFGVWGNHDHWHKDFGVLENLLKETQIVILNNENIKLNRNNEYVYLIGVDDPYTQRSDLLKATEGIENNIPKILLAHSPDIIEKALKQKIDLVLAGHTHGGQINLPLLCPLWVPSKYGKQYLKGLFKIESTYMYVNRGIGTVMIPIRFNSPPEITLIELKGTNVGF